MTVPPYKEFFKGILQVLSDEKEKKGKEINHEVADLFEISEEDRKELLPSGTQRVIDNRVGWGRTYLKKAGLIESKKRSYFNITKEGLDLLKKKEKITLKTLENYHSFCEFRFGSTDVIKKEKDKLDRKIDLSPEEQIDISFSEINNELASSVLEEVKRQSPEFFEKLVIDLLIEMGYGGSRKNAGRAVGKVGDEGIDGIIDEDRLGLDKIYIQAKRYAENSIGRPELQKFVGALGGKGAKKGIFITTSKFTEDAKRYVETQAISSIVLIDGIKLSKLMIDFNVGVSQKQKYEIKQIDSDYFEEYS
ncbi:MAG: restriction endonuclease [Methanobrevibacter sp.]|jgi:restriction system protein|nr:restriction endonuclease [Candidatus Methanoflexus mossambicus]